MAARFKGSTADMCRDHFNPFGVPCVAARELTRLERIRLLRSAAGTLQAGRIDRYSALWLGQVLASWLESGEALEDLLGVRPEPGCKLTVAQLTRAERCDAALLQLSVLVGGDREAARVLAGQSQCPERARPVLERLRALNAPTSLAAITRARRRCDVTSSPSM